MVKDLLKHITDHLLCQDHPLLLLHQMAQIQHFGLSSKQLTKMVSSATPQTTILTTLPGSGQLSEKELRAALVNGDWSSFDPHTVKMMIRMFDSDRSGTIGFDEFCGLWGFLAAWRSLFDRFDADRSGNISLDEYTNALVAFGYRLSPQFVDTLFRTYDKRGEGAISFDLFVQSCISLKRMTDVFKKYDDDRDGFITLSL
jgi:Ca2+-binding EF-hand superfamily protein